MRSKVLPLALEKVCAGGSWPSLPQLPKPQVKVGATGSHEAPGEKGDVATRNGIFIYVFIGYIVGDSWV